MIGTRVAMQPSYSIQAWNMDEGFSIARKAIQFCKQIDSSPTYREDDRKTEKAGVVRPLSKPKQI